MAIKIDIPDSSFSETEITLGGISYNFIFRYSGLEDTFYLDLEREEQRLVSGLRLNTGNLLTGKYDLPDFEGQLVLVRLKETDQPPSRDNVGIGKAYELIYLEEV